MSRNKNKSTRKSDSTVVKIAVEWRNATDKVPQLIEFNQKNPLSNTIKILCRDWGLQDHENYALQFSDANNHRYVTDKDKKDVKNGSVLRLELSPAKSAKEVVYKITNGTAFEKSMVFKRLPNMCQDITFAKALCNEKGLHLIMAYIEENILHGVSKDDSLNLALICFIELMDHAIVPWSTLEKQFITQMIIFINIQDMKPDPKVIKSCLRILENIILNGPPLETEISIESLKSHWLNAIKDLTLQRNVVSLINTVFSKADMVKRESMVFSLCSTDIRRIVCTLLFNNGSIATKETALYELEHQLHALQTYILSLQAAKMRQRADEHEQESRDKIKKLQDIAFGSDNPYVGVVMRRPQCGAAPRTTGSDCKHLGFECESDPINDFNEVPPGVLALDCMLYFAKNYPDTFKNNVLQNSRTDEYECPFGKSGVKLVKLLCDILHVGESPSQPGCRYYPVIFSLRSFEELFCVCIVTLIKTWKEMKATTEDFDKVFGVVREQITSALGMDPRDLDDFRKYIKKITYEKITKKWKEDRNRRQISESQARPIVELREKIKPEIIDLIKQQRLKVLVDGTRFKKYLARGQRIKDKFWFVRLSPNHKMLHYGECDEKSTPKLEELSKKVAVADIKRLVTGKDCPHMKDIKGYKASHLAFSLMVEMADVNLDFIAPNEQLFDFWTDGINAILKEEMRSISFKEDLQKFWSLELKLRLLNVEGVEIPESPPPIPDEPADYDFLRKLRNRK